MYLFKYKLLLLYILYTLLSFSKSVNSNLEFIFLNIIINSIPKPYSKPAKPKINMLDDNKVISSFIAPKTKT
jgi:hypothetical protein